MIIMKTKPLPQTVLNCIFLNRNHAEETITATLNSKIQKLKNAPSPVLSNKSMINT